MARARNKYRGLNFLRSALGCIIRGVASVRKYEASDIVRNEWLRRIEAEYGSAALTQHLTLWLMQIGASPDLIYQGLRIARDEMDHAKLSHDTYLAAGGTQTPRLLRERLGLKRSERDPLEHDVTRVAVNSFCLGETAAVRLFKSLRQRCTVPVARKVLDRVLRDEVRHRDFGWTLIEWLIQSSPSLRDVAAAALPRFFGAIRIAYGVPVRHISNMAEADRAWGLMPPSEYVEVVEATLDRDWVPRFREIGIDARAAWELIEPAVQASAGA